MRDILLFGAGGFTGRQTVAYLAKHAPPELRWAVAGRHRRKLEAALGEAAAPSSVEILVADSAEPASVDAALAGTRVVLTTAGPFARYGTPVLDACVRFGIDYVDITGESRWVHEMAERHHTTAAGRATRIVPFCGFDSVPSDLGTWLLVRALQKTGAVASLDVRTYFRLRGGGLNGGTAATMIDIARTGGAAGSAGRGRPERLQPTYDPEVGTWVGPFFMGPINAWVVRRSARLQAEYGTPYPQDFSYRELLRYPPPLARVKATAATVGAGVVLAGLRHPASRRVIAAMLPKPGAGPSADRMDGGSVECLLIGRAGDGRRARVTIDSPGDAGNRSTVRFACESALALALDAERLPGGRTRGGVLTPATGLGEVVVDRLRRAGVTIDVVTEAA